MPLLKYFTVIGAILLGLLFVANGMLSRPKHHVYASKFDQATPAWIERTVARTGQILVAPTAPKPPHIAEIPIQPVATVAAPTPVPAKLATVERHKKKLHVARRARPETYGDSYSNDSWDRPWSDSWSDGNPRARDAYAYAPRKRDRDRQNPDRQDSWFR
jgi:hypothetical protein